jgi:hypothetical protein
MVTVRMESLRLISTDGISIHLPLAAARRRDLISP